MLRLAVSNILLELIIRLQQNGAVISACHVFEQAGVKHEELELVQLVKGCQGILHLGDIVDAVQHPGGNQPLDGFLKVPGPAVLPDGSVHGFLIGLCQLCYDAAECHQNEAAVDLTAVFGEVVFIYLDQSPWDFEIL